MKLELSKATIYYECAGEGYPLLALHGWMTDHRYMQKMCEPAFDHRTGWRRIYIDIPGHGQSTASAAIRTSDDVLDTLLEFVDAEIQGERFAVAGSSYGSILARGLVGRRSDQVSGLLLVAPDVDHDTLDTNVPDRSVIVRMEPKRIDLQPLERRLYENELVVQNDAALDILREIVAPAFEMADSARLKEISDNYNLSIEEGMKTQTFDGPSLFLMGRQDHRTGYQNPWSVLENYPRASFVVLDRAGHTIGAIEQTFLCKALISDWLDRVEEVQLGKV